MRGAGASAGGASGSTVWVVWRPNPSPAEARVSRMARRSARVCAACSSDEVATRRPALLPDRFESSPTCRAAGGAQFAARPCQYSTTRPRAIAARSKLG